MTDEIKVSVASYGESRNLMMTYYDPVTGKKVARSTGTRDETKAIGKAAVWQDELNSGRYVAPSRMTWDDFRAAVDEEKLAPMPESSQMAYGVALDHLERLAKPDRVTRLTPQLISRFQTEARKEKMRETTLARHLRHIKAVLRWGERQGYLSKAPAIEMPKTPKGQSLAKHRPVTAEEFERMLAAVPKVRKHDADAWKRLLHGLWLSGLRASEAVILDWDEGPFVLNCTGKHPAFYIEAEGQKSRRSEIAPVTPDFWQWLQTTIPESERHGRVFPIVNRKTGKNLGEAQIKSVVRAIGRKANVVVATTDKTVIVDGKPVSKLYKACAGSHDLRRSFCSRWAKKVMPAVLQRLARHAHISTTMSYYVALNADEIGDDLWAGNTLGNTAPKRKGDRPAANRPKSLSH